MRRKHLCIQALLALVVFATATPAHTQALSAPAVCETLAAAGPDVDAVRQLELRGAQVNVEGWRIAEARAFFAQDFVSIAPDGTVNNLDGVMSSFVDGQSRGWARSFDIVALDIKVYDCTAAVVVGLAEVRPLAAPVEAPAWRIRFLNVWRRENGRWIYAANQFTQIADLPATQSRQPGG